MAEEKPSGALNVGLWVVQGLIALTFVGGAIWKFLTPLSTIAGMIPWAGDVPPAFFYFTALVDLLGGIGVILPTITGIAPRVASAAAVGCATLMVCAIVFHVARGEAANTPFNFVMLGLAAFVAWGRFTSR
jgi:hypothetical protein